ncbi:MAG: DUF3298 and DUF4163 domain-containing protein [Acidobacteria bacterium]|nr:DUF3298 and DUF4163 domain-containing protein [Acidobacteriota bacterium]
MRSRNILAATLVAMVVTASAVVAQQSISLKGGVWADKGRAPFEMTLTRSGDTISGSYYYLRSGSANKLTLKGKVGADGTLTMQEYDSTGKQTGEFKGKWHDDADDAGVSLEGDWTKTGATDSKGFFADQQMVFFAGAGKFSTLSMKESIKLKRTEMSAEYPQLTGVPNAAGFNVLAKARVDREFAAFRKLMMGFTAADIKSEPADMGNYLDIGYSVEYADDSLVSISYSTDEFTGGAHGNQGFFTLTYDLKTGKEVRLADLFKPGAAYLKTIASYAAKDLQARKDPDSGENMGLATDIFADGVKPTADNFQFWAMTKKGLLVLFPPYQVAAYAYGPQQVIVPYSALKGIVRADGPAAKMSH